MNTDPLIKRLRWIMLLVMIADGAITLLGQPTSYWTDPQSANEGHPIVRFFMHQGLVPFLAAALVYGVVVMILVSALPRQIGLLLILTVTLWHYHGACTWIGVYFQSRVGHSMYAAFLAATFVALGLGDKHGGYLIAGWRRTTRMLAGVLFALAILGTSVYLVRVRERRLSEFAAHVATQKMLDAANFIGRFRAADESFEMLRSAPESKADETVREQEFLASVRAAAPTARRVFILYDHLAFSALSEQKAFERRVRSALEAAGATVSFLVTSAGR